MFLGSVTLLIDGGVLEVLYRGKDYCLTCDGMSSHFATEELKFAEPKGGEHGTHRMIPRSTKVGSYPLSP